MRIRAYPDARGRQPARESGQRRSQRSTVERRHPVPPADRAAQPQDAVARVVGLLRLERLRRRPRHRVQRDPRGGRPDRRHPALQVRGQRARRARGSSTGSSPATRRSSRSGRSTTRPGATSTARSSTTARSTASTTSSFRWTAADPQLRWLTLNARGLDVDDRGRHRGDVAALALQGPLSPGGPRGGDRRVVRRPALLPAPAGRVGEHRRSTSAGPATPATSATSCGSRPSARSRCGTR